MSTATPIYVLDANVFIQAHRRYYAFDLCPGFWVSLVHHHREGRIVSIDKVRTEILAGDTLDDWVTDKSPASLFASTGDPVVASHFADMMKWVQAEAQFKLEAKAEFAKETDGWVAAYAMSHKNHVVVTHEEYRPDAKKRVPLPNVCKQFGVTYTDTFAMLKELKVKFNWNAP